MKRNKKSGGGGANWMDTYGDMVTLMLCFFVMLYSFCTIDQQKWQNLVQSLNPSTVEEIEESVTQGGFIEGESSEPNEVTQEDVDEDIEQLYQAMKDYVDEIGMSDRISLGKGSGYVFVSFDDTVFFNGDSYVLLDEGKKILDNVALSISKVSDSIDEVRILGHTAQAATESANNPKTDRFLASNRATVVTVYLQEKNIIDPARLVSVGYGQWRPVADNSTSEGRAQNRRVEMIVTGLDLDSENGDDITQYYTMHDQVNKSDSGANSNESSKTE